MWDRVSPILEKRGHEVTAIDLPGHGRNELPLKDVSMQGYIDYLVNRINQLDHKIVLVGHSMAGAVISQVAERIPDKIEKLVYVTAFLLQQGGSVLEAMQSDAGGEFLPSLVFSDDQSYASVPQEVLLSAGFHDMEQSVIEKVLPLIAEKQSTEPFMAKIKVSEERFGSVPKTFIRTTLDKVATPTLQNEMIANWKVATVYDLESGHFPAFSMPEKLANLLL